MSLLELLLVLAVLSTVVALSWPALRRPMNRSYVQNAAQQLQKDLLNTRLEAMETGRPRFFQYRWGSSDYHIGTVVLENGVRNDLQVNTGVEEETLGGGRSMGAEMEEERNSIPRQLPVGTTFSLPVFAETSTSQNQNETANAGAGNSPFLESSEGNTDLNQRTTSNTKLGITEGDWSLPIRLYPSGRMESRSIFIDSEDGYRIEVQIQGLAGRVKISAIERRNEEDLNEVPEVP